MENSIPVLLSLLCVSLCILMKLCFSAQAKSNPNKLPPGPKPWPILGNISQLTTKPHHALATLSRSYGPLMTLNLGRVRTVVVSSPDVARDLFLNHDLPLSSRHAPDVLRALNHRQHSMVWLPVSPRWRNLRKLAAIQVFSAKRLDETEKLRQSKVVELMEYVGQCCTRGEAVDIGRAAFTTSLNSLSNTFFSTDLAGYTSASSQEFKDVVCSMMECVGRPNLADFFPVLSWFDPQGIRRETRRHFSRMFVLFDDMISRRMSADKGGCCGEEDVLETLLRITQEDGSEFSVDDVKHLLLDLFAAGTDTTSSTLEWAMTELLCNPSKMVKAQSELNEVLKSQVLTESDIERLPYLQAIVKETLRLHPPAPLLVPRKANDDVELRGYLIPKNTQVLVNVWAIGRDPVTWKNPNEFSPERFLERVGVDVRGRNFELIPFGAGRRICPGLPLAYRVVHVMLGSLVRGFGWKLPNGMGIQEMDMDDRFGLTLQKAKPLLLVPLPK